MKKALITGVTGQDGSYLTELLLEKNYEVYGMARRSSVNNLIRIEHCLEHKNFHLVYGDITDSNNITNLIQQIDPDEIYNLAGQSDVGISFIMPNYTMQVNGIGCLNILEAIRILGKKDKIKVYQASTSELFGDSNENIQDEMSQMNPVSPYGFAKQYAYQMIKQYRNIYGMYAVNGILFNHESERRGENFVTRKITLGVAKIKQGKQKKIQLGNVDSKRDWGYAKDYVEVMWKMLQQKEPEDFVIATGKSNSVREFCTLAFKEVGIDIEWIKKENGEIAINKETKEEVVEVNDKFKRPKDVNYLCGNPNKAIEKLGWNPDKTSLEKLIKIMIKHDMEELDEKNK